MTAMSSRDVANILRAINEQVPSTMAKELAQTIERADTEGEIFFIETDPDNDTWEVVKIMGEEEE